MIFYGKQFLDNEEVIKKTEFITQGPKSREFEQNLKIDLNLNIVSHYQVEQPHFIWLEKHWDGNDLVLTTPITFLATLNSIIYNNASPVLVDINKYIQIQI